MQGTRDFRSTLDGGIPVSVMWLLIVLVVVSVVATLVARLRTRDESDSVDAQQRRLSALRTAVSGTNAPGETTRVPLPGPGRMRERRGPRLSRSRSVFVAGAAVVTGLAVLAVVLAVNSAHDTGRAKQNAASSRPPGSSPATSSTSTSSTTLALPVGVLSADGSTVSVSLPAGPYELTLKARAACWMRAQRADNTVVETTTLRAGDTHQLTESGPLTVRLGNPGAVDVAINGQALALPVRTGAAVDLQLNPAA
jgi:cytoskeletal protein RodZ